MSSKTSLLKPPSRNDRLVVGVSGGADSVALLGMLFETCPAPTRQLIVAHVNYGLRGRDSMRDERFVRDLASGLGLTCRVLRMPAQVRRKVLGNHSVQDRARNVRYGFFARLARERRAWGAVVAHQRDDQAETVLDRLLRGAGSRGLSGLRAVQMLKFDGMASPLRVWRPLLRFPGKDLRDYLKSRQILWREDSSNRKDVYRRNRIRNEILPLLSKFDPRVTEALVRTGETSAADEDFLEQAARDLDRKAGGVRSRARHGWPSRSFSRAPLAMQRRLVRLAAARLEPDARGLAYERVEEAVRVLSGMLKGPRDLGYGLQARLDGLMAVLRKS